MHKTLSMKMSASVRIIKGWDIWNKMADEMTPEMESAGMKFIFNSRETDEKNSFNY